MLVDYFLLDILPYRLFKVEGELVQCYNRALMKLTGHTTGLTSFLVDKRGYSPQIGAELGEHYLQNTASHRYLIIVSPSQKNADYLQEEFSFDSTVVDSVYRNYSTIINGVTRVDCLYGELDDGINHFHGFEDNVLLRKVQVELDTPSGFLGSAKKLQQMVGALRNNPDLLIENNAAHLYQMLELVAEVGDIRGFNFVKQLVVHDIESYYSELHGGVCVFRSIPGGKFQSMRLPSVAKAMAKRYRKEKHPNTLIIHNADHRIENTAFVSYLHLEEKGKIIEFLLHNEFVEYDQGLVSRRLQELENLTLAQLGVEVNALSPPQHQQAMAKWESNMPSLHRQLVILNRELKLGNNLKTLMVHADAQMRAMLLKPRDETDVPVAVISHLLSKWWAHDVPRLYFYNKKGLLEQYQQAEAGVKAYIRGQCQRQRLSEASA